MQTFVLMHKNENFRYTSQVRNATGLDPYRLYNPQDQQNTIVYVHVAQWPEDNLVQLTRLRFSQTSGCTKYICGILSEKT